MKYLLAILFFLPLLSFGQDVDKKKFIKKVAADKTGKMVCVDKVIPDKETAIAVAEPILFKVYGKDKIIKEKPYNVILIDGYWWLTGGLPKSNGDAVWLGGTFSIILSAKDARVIQLIHYK